MFIVKMEFWVTTEYSKIVQVFFAFNILFKTWKGKRHFF